jgi:hypothetical protein
MKKKGAFLIALATTLLSVLLVFSLSLPHQTPSEISSSSKNMEGLAVLAIGESTDRFKTAIGELKCYGAQIKLLNTVPESEEEIGEGMAVLFDGDWLKGNWLNPTLHNFLRNVVPKKCKLATVGGETSNFFKALDEAGVFEIPVTETGEVRNPAYMNPPVVGYRVKVKQGSLGDEIFLAFGDDAVECLLEWLKEGR